MAKKIETMATNAAAKGKRPSAGVEDTGGEIARGVASTGGRDFFFSFHNSTYSGKRRQNVLSRQLYSSDCAAYCRFCSRLVSMLPNVGFDSIMKEYRPVRIVETDHIGFQLSGWKSDMERQSLRFGWNLPEGVHMRTLGGLSGYSLGKINFPW